MRLFRALEDILIADRGSRQRAALCLVTPFVGLLGGQLVLVGRHKNSSKRKPRGTGGPTPGKNRKAHEDNRAKPASLDALAKELPADTLDSFANSLSLESDRSAAIRASAFLEQTLEELLATHLVDAGENVRKQWFSGATAPFQTFSAKITMGFAMGIYGPVTKERLDRIRNIRNVFAHRSLPLEFSNPTVQDECKRLFNVPFLPDAEQPVRTRYCSACLWLGDRFIRLAHERGGAEIERALP